MRQIEYVKYNSTRARAFRLKTVIVRDDSGLSVEKSALDDAGIPHIASFADKYEKIKDLNPRISFLEPAFKDGGKTACFPYLAGKSINDALGEKIIFGEVPYEALEDAMILVFPEDFSRDADGAFVINDFSGESFIPTADFEKVFGKPQRSVPAVCDEGQGESESICGEEEDVIITGRTAHTANVDGLFENFMIDGDKVTGIDYEWVFDFPVPAKFLHFRNLLYFYRRYENVIEAGEEEIMLHFGISDDEQEIFMRMEDNFQAYVRPYEDFGYMQQYEQPTKTLEYLQNIEDELHSVRNWCENLQAEIDEKDTTIVKQQEVQRLTDNHVYNLNVIIGDLRRENTEIANTLQYLSKHEAFYWKILRRCHQWVDRIMPKGTKSRKIFTYIVHPARYWKLWFSPEGRNLMSGDFKIGEGYLENGKLKFKKENNPLVSIIIPAYNEVNYTYNCLLSILQNTGDDTPYEVLIADDVSTDATKDLNKYAENVILCRTETNQGFLKNCNNAAKSARGKYIMFLNNDTHVTPGWLSSLVKLIESDPSVGMVGSKLVFPDGTLQEAGGIIWSDGSGWNYGRGDDPNKAEYNYVKDVDYISGAAIMLSKKLWDEIGGFDERYAPAYCEDSDLAFEVRKAGYRVVYQPLSEIIHYEGVSNGTDVQGTGFKHYQLENSEKLREKWADELKKQSVNTGNPNPFRARERSQGKPLILVVDHYVPTFDKDAGSRTTFQYLKMFLEKGYVVKFLGDNFLHEEPYSTELEQMGIEILYGEEYQTGIWEWIDKNKDMIDIAYLNRPHIAVKYVDYLKKNTDIKLIYYGHDLHYLREYREYELTGDIQKKRDSDYWKSIELSLMEKVAVSYYPSCVEEEAIHKARPDVNVKAITAYVYEEFRDDIPMDFGKREGLLFVGGFAHPPNADGVLWFVNEVFPLIRQKLGATFYVVGSNAPDEITALNDPDNGIVIKGYVTDEELGELYSSCRLVVVPLRYGAGVKGKVIEAVYNGSAIVTTWIGAEGIPDAETVMKIADGAEAFADEVVALYNDVDECRRMSEKTQEYIRDHFSVDAAWSVIEDDFRVP